MVERQLPKLDVAGSSPVFRSNIGTLLRVPYYVRDSNAVGARAFGKQQRCFQRADEQSSDCDVGDLRSKARPVFRSKRKMPFMGIFVMVLLYCNCDRL